MLFSVLMCFFLCFYLFNIQLNRCNKATHGGGIRPPRHHLPFQSHTDGAASVVVAAAPGTWRGADPAAPHAGVIPSVWALLWEREAVGRREGARRTCASRVYFCVYVCWQEIMLYDMISFQYVHWDLRYLVCGYGASHFQGNSQGLSGRIVKKSPNLIIPYKYWQYFTWYRRCY